MDASACEHTADSYDGRRRLTCPAVLASASVNDQARDAFPYEVESDESDDDDDDSVVSSRTALRLSTPRPRLGERAREASQRKRPSNLSDLTVTFDTWQPRAPASGKREENAGDFASARSMRQSFS